MALLDLQGMELPEYSGGHSSHSKSCGGGASTLSLLLC
ncbi:MAG: SapB/AmfS family lanthipeptide [Actinomadura sp.]